MSRCSPCPPQLRPAAALAALLVALPAVAAPTAPASERPPSTPRPSLVLESGRNSTRVGEFTVHYAALPSTRLSPEIAHRHAITRSASRALLNVSVRRGARAVGAVAVPARIEAIVIHPGGQRQTLNLREVRDHGAIYYLGDARIDAGDTLNFELTVLPEGAAQPINVRHRQAFWPDVPVR